MEDIPPDMKELIDELRQIIKNNGGKPPAPSKNPAFWEKVDMLKTVYGLSYGDISKMLGVDRSKVSTYLHRYRTMKKPVETHEVEPEQSQEEIVEEPSGETSEIAEAITGSEDEEIPPFLQQLFKHYIVKHFGKNIDKKIATDIFDMFRAGEIVKTKYMPSCIELGFNDLAQCVDTAMTFYLKYRDRVEMLENESKVLRQTIEMITDFVANRYMVYQALVYILDKWASHLIRLGYPPDKVLDLYTMLKHEILNSLQVGA